jgi:large subunit ribosomal protein L10e
MGDSRTYFPYKVVLMAKGPVGWQIRDNAIESARLAASRGMEKTLGKLGYLIRLRIYPHHILRENPLAAGAGADRMSTGMKHSFGKPIGIAAQVRPNQVLIEINTTKANVELAKKALKQSAQRLPNKYTVQILENPKPKE